MSLFQSPLEKTLGWIPNIGSILTFAGNRVQAILIGFQINELGKISTFTKILFEP